MVTQSRFKRKVLVASILGAGFLLFVLMLPQWALQTTVAFGGLMMWDELRYYGDYRMQYFNTKRHCDAMYAMLIAGLTGISLVIWFPHHVGMLITVAIVVIMTDSVAQLMGMRYGKPGTFMPKISPNKSLIGVVAGVSFGMLAALAAIIVWYLCKAPLHPIVGCALLAVPVLSVFGDLLESATKRKLQIKDFGSTLGSETGGLLDRLDSWLPSFFVIGMAQTVVFYLS